MPDDDWKKSVDKEIRDCNIAKTRLQDKDVQQQKELDTDRREILDLYDEKNEINNRLAIIETGKVNHKAFNELKTCVSNVKILLKTERKFLPWIAMIVSLIAGIGTIVFIVTQMAEGAGTARQIDNSQFHKHEPLFHADDLKTIFTWLGVDISRNTKVIKTKNYLHLIDIKGKTTVIEHDTEGYMFMCIRARVYYLLHVKRDDKYVWNIYAVDYRDKDSDITKLFIEMEKEFLRTKHKCPKTKGKLVFATSCTMGVSRSNFSDFQQFYGPFFRPTSPS